MIDNLCFIWEKEVLKHSLMYNTTLFQRWYRKWCVKYMAKYGTCFYSCFCTAYITYIYSSHVSVLTWHISIHFTLYTSCFYTCCTVQVAYFNLYTMLYILHLVCIQIAVLSTLPVSVDVAVLVPGCSGVQLNGGWLITIHSQHLQ